MKIESWAESIDLAIDWQDNGAPDLIPIDFQIDFLKVFSEILNSGLIQSIGQSIDRIAEPLT